MSVLAPGVANLWLVIESYRIDPAPLFAVEGLHIAPPILPGSRLSYRKVDRVRARAAALTGDEAFGLRAAMAFHPSQLGALGYAWLASSSLHTALLRAHRYVRVLNDTASFEVAVDGGLLVASISVGQDSQNRWVRDDGQMALLVTLCRSICGRQFSPAWLSLRHAAPLDPAPYRDLFRCPLEYGAALNALAVPLAAADRLLPGGNPQLAQMSEQVVIRRLARLDRSNVSNRVRAAIMESLPSGNVSDESIAADLHMTPRTMNRRLRQEGQSFRGLLKEVRQDLAEQYMLDDSLTLTEISFLLGFAEMSSFSRAFKKWRGVSPSEARRSVA
jgi:AraC-like DNA-binding protein